jgi:hypothetical protein
MKNLRALARSLRSVKLGDRAKSCPLPLPIRLARLSRTKPRGCAGIRSLRRPYVLQKKDPRAMATNASKAVSANAKPPGPHHGTSEALQCPGERREERSSGPRAIFGMGEDPRVCTAGGGDGGVRKGGRAACIGGPLPFRRSCGSWSGKERQGCARNPPPAPAARGKARL